MLSQIIQDFDYEYYDPYTDHFKKWNSKDRHKQWTVLFFYPADFTSVCPTELEDLAQYSKTFDAFGQTKMYMISSDTVHAHQQWIKQTPKLHGFPYAMIGDRNHFMSQMFGVYDSQTGNAQRATIVIDPERKIVSFDVIIDQVGRWSREIVRRIAALQYTYTHKDHMCPSSREPWEQAITPGECLIYPKDLFKIQ